MKVSCSNTPNGQIVTKGSLVIAKTYISEPTVIDEPNSDRNVLARQVKIEAVQNGQRQVINELLPKPWNILEFESVADRMNAFVTPPDFAGGDSVLFPSHVSTSKRKKNFLVHRTALLVILHEIGHAHKDHRDLSKVEIEERDELQARLLIMGNFLPKSLRSQYEKYILEPEKQATQFALETIERLRAEGIDLEPQLTIDELHDDALKALEGYQDVLYY